MINYPKTSWSGKKPFFAAYANKCGETLKVFKSKGLNEKQITHTTNLTLTRSAKYFFGARKSRLEATLVKSQDLKLLYNY